VVTISRARFKHERSKIAAWQGKLKDAFKLSQEAHRLVSAGKPTHASTMAAEYRMDWIAMLLDEYDLALQHLQKALVICQLNEPHRGNTGELARVQWRISQVYNRMGNPRDAQAFYEGAVKSKQTLLDTGECPISDEEETSWDALVGLLYR
jgi:tetratricopeptide (TPR) repeat protein